MPKVIQFIKSKLELHRGLDIPNPYSKNGNTQRSKDKGLNWTLDFILPQLRCSRTFHSIMTKQKSIRLIGSLACFILITLVSYAIFPISLKPQTAEATTGTAKASETTLTLSTGYTTARMNLTVANSSGTFASSSSEELAKFTVATDNYTGYTLTLTGSDDTQELLNSATNTTLSSIPNALTETAFDSSTYNGKWGYKPSKYNSVLNTDTYYPAPTTSTIATLDTTSVPNSTANEYTIGLGARADYTTASGEYTKTFILNAIANDVAYTISYKDNTGDSTVTGSPITPATTTAGSVSGGTASSATLSSGIPTRTGYTFKNWCLGTVSDSGTVCTGTTFSAGDSFGIDQTLDNTDLTLYAVWEINTYSLTINFAGTGVSSVKVCKTSGDCSGNNLVGTISTSGDSISNLPYNSTYYLYPTFTSGYEVNYWVSTGSYGTLSSTSATNPTFTIGAGDGEVKLNGRNTPTYTMQNFTSTLCSELASSTSYDYYLKDVRDNQYYSVRYINGNCWMTENLRLGYDESNPDNITLTLSSSTSNIESVYTDSSPLTIKTYDLVTFGPSTSSGECYGTYDSTTKTGTGAGYTNPCIHAGTISATNAPFSDIDLPTVWYNFAMASADTITGTSNNAVLQYDICSSGWRLPTLAEALSIGDSSSTYVEPFNAVYGGAYGRGSNISQNRTAHWWASTVASKPVRRRIGYDSTNTLMVGSGTRDGGDYIRCILSS